MPTADNQQNFVPDPDREHSSSRNHHTKEKEIINPAIQLSVEQDLLAFHEAQATIEHQRRHSCNNKEVLKIRTYM